MTKVGILSMQRIANYGSFLQAYGLKQILEDMGCSVQFVDYHPGETLIPADGGIGLKRKISKAMEAIGCHAPLKEKIRFVQYKLNYAANYFPYLGISETMNYSPELDVLFIGSDEVFNCVQNNPHVGFTPELFGQNSRATRLVTYAASFGNTTYEKLVQCHIDGQLRNWLNEFDAISVRDRNSEKVIEKLTKGIPECHLDPVLIFDFLNRCGEIPKTVSDSEYILLYGYSGRFSREECRAIQKYANQSKLKILCIGGIQDCCNKFIDCNPFQVIAYFQHAKCVVTDTFHGTILSVITHRQFVSVVRNTEYGNYEKMTDLLKRLGLLDRIVDNMGECSSKMQSKINYTSVDELIRRERSRSYEYLKRQIEF